MTLFGVSEGAFRFGLFLIVLVIMTGLETWLPRRERRHGRGRRWTTNFGMLVSDFLSVSLMTIVVPVTAVVAAIYAESQGWGVFNLTPWPWWIEAPLAFLVLDFVIWFQHWLTHKVPVLWRLHRVHHADHDFDASTGIRFHPLEIIFSIFFKSVAVLILGPAVVVVVVFEAVVNASALFNHANFRLPTGLDQVLRLAVVTPDMHRVHHSVHRDETDSNYGFALSIWDRIFGTYVPQPRDGHEAMVIGLDEYQAPGPEKLGWSLLLPFGKR